MKICYSEAFLLSFFFHLMVVLNALVNLFSWGKKLSCTDTDTRIGIGRIRIRGYGNFLKNPIHGYVL